MTDAAPNGSNSVAILSRQQLGVGAEMQVKVILFDSIGRRIKEGGAKVRGKLSGNEGNGLLACY